MSDGPSLHKPPFHDPGHQTFSQPVKSGSGAGPVLFVLSAVVVLAMIIGGGLFALGALSSDDAPPAVEVGRSSDTFGSDPAVAAGADEDEDEDDAAAEPSSSSSRKTGAGKRIVRGDLQIFEGGGATRGLAVTLPNPIVDGVTFPVSMDGATGKGETGLGSGGGFIVKAHLMRGDRACPDGDVVHDGISTTNDELGSMNVFVAGKFRWAQSGYAGDVGPARVCGYLSHKGLGNGYDLVIDQPAEVEENTGRRSYDEPPVKPGTYVAEAGDLDGATEGGEVAITIVPGDDEPLVERVQVKGATLSTCPMTEDNPLRGTAIDVDLSAPGVEGLDNDFIGDSASARFKIPGSDYGVSEAEVGSDGRQLRGMVTVASKDGQCSGNVAFTARLRD